MVRNICKEDVSKLSELLGKTLDVEAIDYELSMLDDVDDEIRSAFVVGKYRVPYEIGAYDDDDFYYHEVLDVYCKENDEVSLNIVFYDVTAATKGMVLWWTPWTKERAALLSPAFIEKYENNMQYLSCLTFPPKRLTH